MSKLGVAVAPLAFVCLACRRSGSARSAAPAAPVPGESPAPSTDPEAPEQSGRETHAAPPPTGMAIPGEGRRFDTVLRNVMSAVAAGHIEQGAGWLRVTRPRWGVGTDGAKP